MNNHDTARAPEQTGLQKSVPASPLRSMIIGFVLIAVVAWKPKTGVFCQR